MTMEETVWWEKMIREEEDRVKSWDSLNEEDYAEAGNTFNLLQFKYTMPNPVTTDQDDRAYNGRDENLFCLIKKKDNQPVSYLSTCTCLSIIVEFSFPTYLSGYIVD